MAFEAHHSVKEYSVATPWPGIHCAVMQPSRIQPMPNMSQRNPTDRLTVDQTVVVLGAGINGAALARELLLSGVSVAMVDASDIASGATAWSTRLIHGGLRYLEYGEIGLVRESLAERNRLVRLAPHLVKPLEFVLPVERRFGGMWAAAARLLGWESLARRWRSNRGRGSWTVSLGLTFYDWLSIGSGWPWHRVVRSGRTGLPRFDAGQFPLAGVYWDAQLLYPERFTVELLVDARRIAAETGAMFSLFTHHTPRLLPDGRLRIEPTSGRGAEPSGGVVTELVPAGIVNATGAWVDRTLPYILPSTDGSRPESRLIGGTKGSHVVLRSTALRKAIGSAGLYAEAADGRPVFVLPFGPRLVLVGTTDIPFYGDPADAQADGSEIAYLLEAAARFFPDVALGREHVQQHYCGVRPLPASNGEAKGSGLPASVTRRHMLVRHADAPLPTWSIVGGKLTTCRSLAEKAAAEVLGCLQVAVRDTSRNRPLPGASADAARTALIAQTVAEASRAGVPEAAVHRVAECTVDLFGARAMDVFAESGRGEKEVARRVLIRGTHLPAAAIEFCIREEWAASLEDIVERRLMLLFAEELTYETLDDVAEVLVGMHVLPREQKAAEVAAIAARLSRRYGKHIPSQRMAEGESDAS